MIFTYDDTTKTDENWEGKLVIIKEDYFKEEYRNGLNQLFMARGGFGCNPASMGRAVFGNFYDGESCRVNRENIYGIASEDAIAEWESLYGHSREDFDKKED